MRIRLFCTDHLVIENQLLTMKDKEGIQVHDFY